MTQDEIIRMAREAGCYEKYEVCYFVREDLERFYLLAWAAGAAHEREKQAEQEPLEDCYKVTYEDGTSCHFGNKRLAEINAGKGDKIEVVKLRALRLVEAAPQPVKQEPVHEALQIASVALQDIACSSQTENLYWWQLRARKAQRQISERLINASPVRTKDLSDDEIQKIWEETISDYKFARAVIAADREKNK